MDMGFLNYNLSSIRKNQGRPISFSRVVGEELMPHIKAVYPEAQSFSDGEIMYITVSKRARIALCKELQKRKDEYERRVQELENIISQIR